MCLKNRSCKFILFVGLTVLYNGILVPVRTSFSLRRLSDKTKKYQHEVDVDMLNAVNSLLADVSSIGPSSEQRTVLYIFLISFIF